MSEFTLNFISNGVVFESILKNPSFLYNIWPIPKIILDFSGLKVSDNHKLITPIVVEYGIIGKFKIPPEFNLTPEEIENQPGMIFTQLNTRSDFEIISSSGYFDDPHFKYSIEIENELVNTVVLAAKYNMVTLIEKLKETEMSSYKLKEITEGFMRTAVRELFFGCSN